MKTNNIILGILFYLTISCTNIFIDEAISGNQVEAEFTASIIEDKETKTIIASTASPFKFTRSVMTAIDAKYDSWEDFELVDELSRLGNVAVPNAIEEIRTAPVVHNTVK